MTAPEVDILVQSPRWDSRPDAEAAVRSAIAAAARTVPETVGEISVMLTDDEAMRALNRKWRNVDKPTNVLSFPAPESAGTLGDIVISYGTVARESIEEGKDFLHHLSHLAVHGFLHLIGYDHETDSEAEAMERLETAILARLDIPDPYLVRDTET